jgi:hypothetical protein
MRIWLLFLLFGVACGTAPNIIFIFADDLGPGEGLFLSDGIMYQDYYSRLQRRGLPQLGHPDSQPRLLG